MPGRADRDHWADLRARTVSAAVLAPFVLVGLWAGGAGWVVLVLLGLLGMSFEWLRLCRFPILALPGLALPLIVAFAAFGAFLGRSSAALGAIAAGVALGLVLPPRKGAEPAWLGLGVGALGLAGVALVWLRAGAAGRSDCLFVQLVVWATDIGAFTVGRLIGGPLLAPSISPAKTMAGAAGGLMAGSAMGVATATLLAPGGSLRAALIGLVLAGAAELGDLAESALKRRFGVKDSGRLIPGHGGLLDRLDGLMAAAMVAALVALAGTRGVPLWQSGL